MPKFRKKPVVIDAVRYEGDTTELPYDMGTAISRSLPGGSCFITTLEGEMECRVGDWIIKGVAGELYPCKDSIFRATYEAVESEVAPTYPWHPTESDRATA